eukprot:116304_1
MSDEEHKVEIYLYDLTQGMARQFSPQFLGQTIEGIWHTGVVAYGCEYFYGGGIQRATPGGTMAGTPMRIIPMGTTAIPQEIFHDFLREISHRFTMETYSLLNHNCNNFTAEAAQFLTGKHIPDYITGLPAEVLSTPLGALLRPMIEGFESQMRGGGVGGMAGQMGIPVGGESEFSAPAPVSQPAPIISSASTPESTASPQAATVPSQTQDPVASGAIVSRSPTKDDTGSKTDDSGSKKDDSEPKRETDEKEQENQPAERRRSSSSNHPHTKLGLSCITENPILQSHTDVSIFVKLFLSASKKLTDQDLKLSAAEQKLIQNTPEILKLPKTSEIGENLLVIFERVFASWEQPSLPSAVGLLCQLMPWRAARAYFCDVERGLPAIYALIETAGLDDEEEEEGEGEQLRLITLCLLAHLSGKLARDDCVLSAALRGLRLANSKPARLSAATVLFNAALALPRQNCDEVIQIVTALAERIGEEKEKIVVYRMLMGLLHLIYRNSEAAQLLLAVDFDPEIRSVALTPKIKSVIADISAILKAETGDLEDL